jgi:hypothetical protein
LQKTSSNESNTADTLRPAELLSEEIEPSRAIGIGGQISSCSKPSVQLESSQSSSSTIPTSHRDDGSFNKRVFSPDKESSGYYGPTSAVFDEKTGSIECRNKITPATKLPDVWAERQLVAESANQRQLETVNFLAGKLDFDGVDPELGMHLLSIYWNRQHTSGPIVYRAAFMRDMACAGPYFSKLLVNAIYFYASKYSPRTDVRRYPNNELTAGWIYRQRAVELLSKLFDKSNITTIQALLIMSNVIFSWCDEKSTSWLYAGMAFNMIIDLGIHVKTDNLKARLSEEEVEVRLRIFWSAYGRL